MSGGISVSFHFFEGDKAKFMRSFSKASKGGHCNRETYGAISCYDTNGMGDEIGEMIKNSDSPPFWWETFDYENEGHPECGAYANGKGQWTFVMADESCVPIVRVHHDGVLYQSDVARVQEYLRLRKEVDLYIKMKEGA